MHGRSNESNYGHACGYREASGVCILLHALTPFLLGEGNINSDP